MTEVGCLALVLVGGGRSVGRRMAVILAVAGMIPLAAMQLWPTYRLARLSDSRRDFEYLSGFAASPIHFVSYAAPGLFHRSPLWRPVVWDPFQHLARGTARLRRPGPPVPGPGGDRSRLARHPAVRPWRSWRG